MEKELERTLERKNSYEKIEPTARIVAYRRSLSDIPFAKEIYNLVKDGGDPIEPSLLRPDLSPQIEARHKIIDRYLDQSGIGQVLEIASGLSPRGLNRTQDEKVRYVELDLPAVIDKKAKIVSQLLGASIIPLRPNLHLVSGNALELPDLERTSTIFDPDKSLAVVNEGLMRYLTMAERARLATNIHALLTKFGGIWITPDISLKRVFENENVRDKAHVEQISKMTGASIVANRFESKEQAKKFFEHLGFDVQPHSWLEVADELTSPSRAGVTPEEVTEMNSLPVLFVMTAR